MEHLQKWSEGIFLGIPMRQWQTDLWLWEKFFLDHKIKRFVELGTGNGGMSLFFLLQSYQYDFDFHTFDIKIPVAIESRIVRLLLNLDVNFVLGDIYTEKEWFVRGILESDYTAMLYCDNGDKPKEVATFAPYLKSGDYLAVHDWKVEIKPENIPDYLEECFTELPDEVGSLTRWFVKK